jgi:hypothetical protein
MTYDYEYGISEGVYLRRPINAHLLEAWSERDSKWFTYDHILKDWMYETRWLAAADVPEEVRTAPSMWREVYENGRLVAWEREFSASVPNERRTLTVEANARLMGLERQMKELFSAAGRASRRGAK